MHQEHRMRPRSIAIVVGVCLLAILGGLVNFQPTLAIVAHELVRMSEIRSQQAEAKLSAFKYYLNRSHTE
ncbi:hypothetical protein CO661_33270 [Sinorhizobium fredii]|uniref:Uncharacterized protein n=1 Tax=Rhizobium fredii TaxID=380 RepID=A0A2A6LNR1_RHIFR|nr:hypothetical protein CO661_33270 [Sinorhizobium fredii]